MIKVRVDRDFEKFEDRDFPEIHMEVLFDEEMSWTDMIKSFVEILNFEGFIVTKQRWLELMEEMNLE